MSGAELSKKELYSATIANRQSIVGMVFVVLGTVCFAAKSIFIKRAYEHGATPEATLLIRQLMATPLFWVILLVNRSKIPVIQQKSDMVKASFAGLLCFFLSPLFDFLGLHDVSAIVERMLVISYPVFVIILSAIQKKRMISLSSFIAIFVIYFGIYMAIGGWNDSLFKANAIGALLIVISSVFYAVYLVLSGQLVQEIGGIRINAYGMSVASLAMIVYLLLKSLFGHSENLFHYSLSVFGDFLLIAVVSTVLSFVLILEGIKRIGAERASFISMLGPIITIFLGTIFLGEHLALIQWLGCAMVLIAITVLELQKIRKNRLAMGMLQPSSSSK